MLGTVAQSAQVLLWSGSRLRLAVAFKMLLWSSKLYNGLTVYWIWCSTEFPNFSIPHATIFNKQSSHCTKCYNILTDRNNPSVILSEVFWWKCDIILLHLITVYLHVHKLKFIENLKGLFGNAWLLGQKP